MNERRGIPVFPIILVVIGAILLLQNLGKVSWGLWWDIWRLWPLLVIAVGINLIFSRRWPLASSLLIATVLIGGMAFGALFRVAPDETVYRHSISQDLEGVERFEVSLAFGAGDLHIGSQDAGSSSLVQGILETRGREAGSVITRAGGNVRLEASMSEQEGFTWLPGRSGADWELFLSQDPEIILDIEGGAASMVLDLSRLRVSRLDIGTGAASVQVTMPSRGIVDARINAGVASIDIMIPDGVAARITTESGLSSVDVDTTRFPKVGEANVSPGYDQAENRVSLHFSGGLSSVNVR